jgi:hypothetical protein
VTHRFDEFAASPVREGLSLVRMIVEAFTGNRQGGTQAPRERRRAQEPEDERPPV